jgi:cell division septal protein FtsQ
VIYILFFSSYFAINAVYIERTDDLSNIDIAYNVVPDLYGKPILTINKNKIIKSLKDLQANLNKVEISRVYPTSLKILLTSYK